MFLKDLVSEQSYDYLSEESLLDTEEEKASSDNWTCCCEAFAFGGCLGKGSRRRFSNNRERIMARNTSVCEECMGSDPKRYIVKNTNIHKHHLVFGVNSRHNKTCALANKDCLFKKVRQRHSSYDSSMDSSSTFTDNNSNDILDVAYFRCDGC